MSVLIAPSVGDVGVLQEKLAPFVTELNTHLAQILEEDPKEGGSVLSLAAACAKRWAGWLMTICMTYESICWPCPGIPGLTINMRLYFYLQNFMGKIPLLVHSNRKYYREGNFGKVSPGWVDTYKATIVYNFQPRSIHSLKPYLSYK